MLIVFHCLGYFITRCEKVRMVGELQTPDCLHGCTYITHYHTLQMVAELFLQTWTAYTAGSAAYRWAGTRRRSKPLSSSRLALQMFWDTCTSSNTNTNDKQKHNTSTEEQVKGVQTSHPCAYFYRCFEAKYLVTVCCSTYGTCLWSCWLSTNLRFFGSAYCRTF